MDTRIEPEAKGKRTGMEALFMERYLEHGNASRAHAEAGFPAASSGARRAAASRLLKRLKPELNKLRAERGLTWDSMAKGFRESIKARQQLQPAELFRRSRSMTELDRGNLCGLFGR